jgi:hypothetical protein
MCGEPRGTDVHVLLLVLDSPARTKDDDEDE